ncbi:hypothetical protein A8924_1417 [Saccharopolyspora erythraea NRRL 2338]|uniref:Uncharacterized protein n=2 Tax=Saccharopolyspora erythraea TaxID=1836 RepID=A4F8I1_SACEN|nr:hypothetical protein [Saccharopolyspora erythraea]EQD85121.1 hypothetical protein N599_16660 [Saccharopolyspora erythraea D]PFG94150.1 hypothetical protein A8924_1417 [Saccharopolyspora erythraea NRRL 2338]QRK90938.1 hypothetical protein JQX30_05635 [Saccharopolyspora erythraea]CAM00356.1 hypothetical protein SACE_1024 [Saccharopolyspora erythraea NRRL 2338]
MRDDNDRSDQAGAPADAATAVGGNSALDRLRTYVNALVDVIAAHPDPSLERDEAQWRLEELADELAAAKPSAPRVKSRWIRLAPVLLVVRPDVPADGVSELVDLAFRAG